MKVLRTRFWIIGWCAVVLVFGSAWSAFAAGDEELQELLKTKLESIQAKGSGEIAGASIAAVDFLPRLYEKRQFNPAWSNKGNVEALLEAIESSDEQGLTPSDFHAEQLAAMGKSAQDPDARADLDILMTDAFVRLAYQMLFGKVDPEKLDADWNFDELILEQDPATVINESLDSGKIGELIADLEPKEPYYESIKAALKRYRQIEANGGWPQIPEGPKLKAGMESDRVIALRRRLQATGDLGNGGATGSTSFDDPLGEAVKRFQKRHGLDADGVVGGKTLAALNVPVEARINQIRVNLERARWVLHNLEPDYIVVNIAGFEVYVVENGEEVWTSRAVVGKPYRKTPVFKATMDHLVFNPTWTVPPTILRNDVLPKVRKDPAYLPQNNFSVIDGSGKRVDPSSVNWSAKNPPYRIVQGSGPKNALGEVKFMFPNKHAVYLHDTPSKSLFDKSERTFSSGCIRVQKPFDLAKLLLRGDSSWTPERIEKAKASGKTETVKLETPLPVLLLYWTVQPEADGTVRFMNDVYERDARILKELDEAFSTRI